MSAVSGNLFAQDFPIPCRAITFDNITGAKIGMGLSGVITDPDSYFHMKRTNRSRARGLKRISNGGVEVIGDGTGEHKNSNCEGTTL
jgi:hypothetical protein